MDDFIKKFYFVNILKEFPEFMLNEIENEINQTYKTIEKDIKYVYDNNEIRTIDINLINALEKKSIEEFDTVYSLDPVLSYFLQEDLYNKSIKYNEEIETMYKDIRVNSNIILVGINAITKPLKSILTNNKIQRNIFFKDDFKTPLKYMIYEYNSFLKQ